MAAQGVPFHQASIRTRLGGGGRLGGGSHPQLLNNLCCKSAGAVPQWKPYVNEDTDYTKWTVLREGDGGRHVHELQVALVQKGFWPGEDDMLWWQFGDATCSAVQTFQVSYSFHSLYRIEVAMPFAAVSCIMGHQVQVTAGICV